VVEVTTKTVQSRMLLRPSRECVRRILGVLGRALHSHPGMKLHAYWFLSNHYHLLLWAPDSVTLTSFMTHLNGNIAREIGSLHKWRQKFWGRRYSAIAVLGEAAQVRRLKYVLAQGTKEGLVARPSEWPGANCLRSILEGRPETGVWYDRTSRYRSDRTGDDPLENHAIEYPVKLDPLPALADESPREYRGMVAELVGEIERETRASRYGKAVLGRSSVVSCDPHELPPETVTPKKRKKKRAAPICHASSPQLRRNFREAYDAFVRECDYAMARLRRNIRSAVIEFPQGAFLPRMPLLRRNDLAA
jgi:hypothetical protein